VVAVIVLLLAIGLALILTRKAKAQNGDKKDAVILQPHYGASPLDVREYAQPPAQVARYDSVPKANNHYAPAPAFSAASGSAETIRTIESGENTYDAPPSVVAMQ
jgi:hypothetical protein